MTEPEPKQKRRGGVRPGVGRPRILGKMIPVTIRVPRADYEWLQEEADRRNVPMPNLFRSMIDEEKKRVAKEEE